MNNNSQKVCPICGGIGTIYRSDSGNVIGQGSCPNCHGSGFVYEIGSRNSDHFDSRSDTIFSRIFTHAHDA